MGQQHWYNNLHVLTNDLKSIIGGHNPTNQPPPVGTPPIHPTSYQSGPTPGMPTPGMPNPSGQGMFTAHFDPNSTQPVGVSPDIDPGTMQKVKDWLSSNWDRLGSGMSDYEKWILALQTIGGAASAYTAYKGQQANTAMDKAQLAEKQREYNSSTAPGLARSIDAAPLRDRASYMLAARLGQSPGNFVGAGLNDPGQMGGIDETAMTNAAGRYTPGAGGTQGSVDIQKKILEGMGYKYGG